MDRRDFLTAGTKVGIILLGAPAIVRAESLMKIWVPEKRIILDVGDFTNFMMQGLLHGDQVYVKDEVTGRVLINERVTSFGKGWCIPPGNGNPLKVGIRRKGCIDYVQRVGSPYPGGKTKIKAAGLLKS